MSNSGNLSIKNRRSRFAVPIMAAAALLLLSLFSFAAFGADPVRNWQSGTLLDVEKIEVPEGYTTTTNKDGSVKDKGKKTDYSQTTTSKTTENKDTFQVYTIEGDSKTYVVRERLLFPWSKPANVTVGEKVKFVVEKNTAYILDEDGKQHKAGVSKISVNSGR